jgi:membrane-bound lytic murein transglycosylase D
MAGMMPKPHEERKPWTARFCLSSGPAVCKLGIVRNVRTLWMAVLLLLPANACPQEEESEPDDWSAFLDRGAEWVRENLGGDLLSQVELPTQEEWQEFWGTVQQRLDSGTVEQMAELMPYVETGLNLLSRVPGGAEYADWLRQRADYFEMAEAAVENYPAPAPPKPAPPPPAPPRPAPPTRHVPIVPPRPVQAPVVPAPIEGRRQSMVHSEKAWTKKLASRPAPAAAASLVPRLKTVFKKEGVPSELVWVAEVESSMNPRARSPAGAAGLFQFMPATARRFGLRTAPADERHDPEKSARAAARYLRSLHGQFGSWPLALSAYNAGEGRVQGLLDRHKGRRYDDIVAYLPTETQMYVPKVSAVVALREGVDPVNLPAPTGGVSAFPPDWIGLLAVALRIRSRYAEGLIGGTLNEEEEP